MQSGRLFKSRHNIIEERSLGVKDPGESNVERPCRGTGGRGGAGGVIHQ